MLPNRINNLGVAPGLQAVNRVGLEASLLWCVASIWA